MRLLRWSLALAAFVAGSPESSPGQQVTGGAAAERRALDHATRLEEAGRPEEAMRALESLLDEQPASVSALLLLSQWAERYGDPGRALPRAEAAAESEQSGLPAIRQIWIRVLYAAGLRDSAVSVARRWIRQEPEAPAAYTELSGLMVRGGDTQQAIEALESGRRSIGSDRLFVQEMAVLQAEIGAYAEAAAEWRAMLAWGSAGVEAVERRLLEAGASRPKAVAALRSEISNARATVLERKGALHLAILLGELDWAREVAVNLARDLPEVAAAEVMRDYVRQATDAGDPAGAAWAASDLARRSNSAADREYWLVVSASLSRDAGDLEKAGDAFARLLKQAKPGSDAYGMALLRLHELTVASAPDSAEDMLREYRSLYPAAGLEVAGMSVSTASEWMNRGQLDRARSVLSALAPADAEQASLQAGMLGRLEILSGRPETARGHLELAAAVPAGDAEARVESLEQLALIGEADSASIAAMAVSLQAARATGDSEALTGSVEAWASEKVRGGGLLAEFAARELEASGDAEGARLVRITLLESWPRSPAAPGALLALARADRKDDTARAAAWLEQLIVEYPESALAPVARSMLRDLQPASARS